MAWHSRSDATAPNLIHFADLNTSNQWTIANLNIEQSLLGWPRPTARILDLQGNSQKEICMSVATGKTVLFGKVTAIGN